MARFWGKIMKGQRIVRDTVAVHEGIGDAADFEEVVQALCQPLDLARPVILSKHFRDMASFRRARFLPGDFMEEVAFTAFEVEELVEKKKS